ncbi:hypothetical protein RIF29_21184 [Crotalaria pallida]|uniref:C2 NT-type domain-containing protein n=1 Tax=Crotalaria pallida TaxID=3830 RepID=A0AAN9F6Z2_CROPI
MIQCGSGEAYYGNEKHLKDSKGKNKTYSLNRHSRDELQERFDFKLYDFQALQVDKGWNKLYVSVISIQTGKTIAKSGKALVQNGQCHWEDSMFRTIWISDNSPEDNEGCLLKFVVTMGSARKDSYLEEMSVGCDDHLDYTSDLSDNTFSRSKGSSHCSQLDKTYHRGERSSKRRSPLAKCLNDEFDSMDSSFSFWIEKFPQQSSVSGLKNNMNDERQDSPCSKKGHSSPHDTSRSMHSSPTSVTSSLGAQLLDKMDDFDKVSIASDTTLTRSVGSSKDLLSAAQVTIELLHGEAKTWEENSRKLMIDVERLQKELSNKSKNTKDLEKQLSASREESAGLKEEIERLTTRAKENGSDNLKLQIEEMDNIIKELKDEIKYQKGLNTDLEMKVKKTQESYIDLVFILRRLENTIEKQKEEIADLSVTSSQFQEAEDSSEEEEFSLSEEVLPVKTRKDISQSDVNMCTNEYAISCLHERIELMQEKQSNMESTIKFLEKTLMEKDQELQSARRSMAQTLEENEAKWRNRLFERGEEIIDLEKKLSDGVHAFSNEIISSTQRVQDLEAEFYEKHGEPRKEGIMSGSFSSNFPLLDYDNAINITQVKRIGDDDVVAESSLKENIFCISSQELRNLQAQLASELASLIQHQQVESEETNKLEPETRVAYLQSKIASHCSTDSQVLVDKDAERSLCELESSDDEQDALVGLQAENDQLSERILRLEAEMRHLNEEKESTRLALENAETVVISLQAEISRLENQNESMQTKWLEAQEECSFMKADNLNLQAANEKLNVQSETLETENGELRTQNLELHSQSTVLESKVGESQIAYCDMLKKVEDLQHRFASMLEEVALKEKTIHADLDAHVQESKEQNERLASNITLLAFDVCADRAMLQASLQEEQEKVKLYETEFDNLQAEYQVKLQSYTQELAATRANHETLMASHEKVVVLLENVKSNEEKLKSTVRRLEVELKTSELERLQATEETSILEVQLQKTEMLQNEVFVLKRSLNEAELEYRRLEASNQILSLEHEELKAEKLSYVQKISTIEKITSELEDSKLSKVQLEEKIVQLEWDLIPKEASCRNNAQLRYDLAQMKKENSELHKQKDSLEAENEEYQKKVKALEEKLKQKEEVKHDQHDAKDSSTSTIAQDNLKLLKKEENCRSIKSCKEPSLLLHPSSGSHDMLQTEQYPELADREDCDSWNVKS